MSQEGRLYPYKPTEQHELNPQVLGKPTSVLTRPLYHLWKEMKMAGDSPRLRKANVAPTFKKGQIHNLRKYGLVSLNFLPGKITDWPLLEHISYHTKEIMMTAGSQHGFTMGKSRLTSLTAFCDQMTGFMDEGRETDAFYFDIWHTIVCVSWDIRLWTGGQPDG